MLKLDRLIEIFNLQRQLMLRYDPLEKANGALFTPDVPVNVSSRAGQMRLKDFLWRATEELSEAWSEFILKNMPALREELIDVLHFVVELCILAGVDPYDIGRRSISEKHDRLEVIYLLAFGGPGGTIDWALKRNPDPFADAYVFEKAILNVYVSAGFVGQLLRNRAWKKVEVKADEVAVKERCVELLLAHIRLMGTIGLFPSVVHEEYVGKHRVNNVRLNEGV